MAGRARRFRYAGDGDANPREVRAALDDLRARVARVYLHVDLDMLDSSIGHANSYAADGGPDLGRVLAAISETFARFEVPAAALTAYDPRLDDSGAIVAAARAIAHHTARLAVASSHSV